MAFASTSVRVHLARGLVGAAALAIAIRFQPLVWPALLGMPVAIWMFRGCPVCWTTGLVQTLAARIRQRAAN